MTRLKKISISGFRGILAPLELELNSGGASQSVILYGGNGTGKSSVTDAWEWLTTGKIAHLAREGAEEGAYPHIAAKPGSTSVHVEFSDSTIGTVGLAFNEKRVTLPNHSGKLLEARKLLTHPCHIRYGDLTRFVFLRKSDRYDALANLMGFVPQMEYQKGLRRVQTQLEDNLKQLETLKLASEESFKTTFNVAELDLNAAWKQMSDICAAHKIETEPKEASVRAASANLKAAVTNDPNARKLADVRIVETAVKGARAPVGLSSEVVILRQAIGQLKAEQKDQLHNLRLIPLFKAATELLAKIPPTGVCPLCHNEFDGDLKEHVRNEFTRMQHLQVLLEKLSNAKGAVNLTLSRHKSLVTGIFEGTETVPADFLNELLGNLKGALKLVDDVIEGLSPLLAFDSTDLTDKLIEDLSLAENDIVSAVSAFDGAKQAVLENTQHLRVSLETDPARVKLVSDNQAVSNGIDLMEAIRIQTISFNHAQQVFGGFSEIVENYVRASLSAVQKRFDEISEKVKVFFEILEKNTAGLGSPKMRLLADQDRSVVLEVFFHGTPIYPAYKFLSESQLNSFGLSVFLASATHFNRNCSFLLLDDVVNSFDAYKRPHLIDLIIDHLENHQVLLLTHDRFWRDLLHRRLPNWRKINFTGYSFGIGPKMAPALDALERITKCLDEDEPAEASSGFAQYLEDVLQDLCETFEVECKFNRRNEYTLDTLIDRLRVRVREKLKQEHPLSKALEKMFENNAYRNWSIHCKNPESAIHKSEVREILSNWAEIDKLCRCQDCVSLLKYDGKAAFRCKCGKQQLRKLPEIS